jgi:hypothetical protein
MSSRDRRKDRHHDHTRFIPAFCYLRLSPH